MTKREAVVTSVTLLAATFNRETSGPLFEAYWLVLKDLTEAELAKATADSLASCRFMPTPAELLGLGRPKKSVTARAAEAWTEIRKAIRKYDYTVASIDFGPLVNTVLRSLGPWEWLCEQSDDSMVWRAKDFERFYEAFATGPEAALRGDPLEGWGAGKIGCDHVRVAIGGVLPQTSLPAAPSAVSDVVKGLADSKSLKGRSP